MFRSRLPLLIVQYILVLRNSKDARHTLVNTIEPVRLWGPLQSAWLLIFFPSGLLPIEAPRQNGRQKRTTCTNEWCKARSEQHTLDFQGCLQKIERIVQVKQLKLLQVELCSSVVLCEKLSGGVQPYEWWRKSLRLDTAPPPSTWLSSLEAWPCSGLILPVDQWALSSNLAPLPQIPNVVVSGGPSRLSPLALVVRYWREVTNFVSGLLFCG